MPKLTPRELASKRITGYLNWHRHRRKRLFADALDLLIADIRKQQPDHLAITGDLVNVAADAELIAARQWLAETGAPRDLSFVPGNHDAYVPGALRKIVRDWRPWMSGDRTPESANAAATFPYIRRRGPVALIGLSTATATPPFMASGVLGGSQTRKAEKLLQSAKDEGLIRVIMIHHPPIRGATAAYKRMIGIRRFARLMASSGAELVIHGHTHLNTVYTLAGANGAVPVVGIASASQGPGASRPASSYNLFELSHNDGEIRLVRHLHQLDTSGQSIVRIQTDNLLPSTRPGD